MLYEVITGKDAAPAAERHAGQPGQAVVPEDDGSEPYQEEARLRGRAEDDDVV